jgi:hypothetical protein
MLRCRIWKLRHDAPESILWTAPSYDPQNECKCRSAERQSVFQGQSCLADELNLELVEWRQISVEMRLDHSFSIW